MNADDVQRAVKAAIDAALGEAGTASTEAREHFGRVVEMEGVTVSVSVVLTAQSMIVRDPE